MELAAKHCVPCEGGVPPLTEEAVQEYLAQVDTAWEAEGNVKIRREFTFNSFTEAMAFVNRVAEIAEAEGHHPDVYIYFKRVVLELTTHAINGLSENDFILAAKVDAVAGAGHD